MSQLASWPMAPLERLVLETQYGTSSKANDAGRGQPIIRMNNLTYEGNFDISDLKWVELAENEREKLVLHQGDLLFNRTNSRELVGKTGVWNGPEGYTFAGYLIRVRLRQDMVLPRWVAAFMNSPEGKKTLFNMAKPSINMANISASDLLRLYIPVAPIEHQKKTIAILDKADAIRRKRKQAIALTDQLLRSTFLEMFGDPVTNPKGWPVATVGDLCEQGGNLVDGPFGSSLKPEHYASSGVRVIRNWNIRDDFFDESDFRYVDFTKFEEIRRSEVSAGDILITTKGTVGDICMMPSLTGESVLSASGTVRLRLPPHSVLLAPFVVWQMILPSYKQYLHSFEAGSAQQYLNLSAIKKMRLMIPSMVDQQRFCNLRLRVLGIKKKQEAAQLDTAALFSSLTDRAFRGELSHTEQVAGQLSMFNK